MTLWQTSFLSGLAVLTKLATSLFLNKVLAVYVGPTGYGVIGQFQSLISMVTTFASGAVNTGVTKYTAEYADLPERQRTVWGTAATLGLLGALVFGAVLVVAREPLSRRLLGDDAHSDVLVWLALSLVLLVMNGLMLAILNGLKAVRELVIANIVGSLVGAGVATALVATLGLWGALVALAISQAVACGFTAWMFRRVRHIAWRDLVGTWDAATARSLGGFALMAATSASLAPLGQIVIRDQLGMHLGANTAGLWQALWKISETHLLLLTTTLSIYFLPRFSEIRAGDELRREVRKGYRFVIPLVVASAGVLYVLREPLIRGLLSPAFLPLAEAFGLQLVGDVLKICSWVMAFTMVSHARTRTFVVTEIVFTAIFVGLTLQLGMLFGLRGAALAYAVTYLIYWGTMHQLFNRLADSLPPGTPAPDGAASGALADAHTASGTDNGPLVSVLMPCFNHERYVEQALQSIADSSYRNVELVFIDDASSDGSYARGRTWIAANQDRFARVVCHRHEVNRGISATLNELVSHSTGSFLTFCASDDLLTPDGLSLQVRQAKASGAEFIFADARLIDETGTLVSDSAMRYFGRDPASLQRKTCLTVDVLLNWEAPWTRIFASANLIRRLGLFDESLQFEDRDFVVRVVSEGSFALVPEAAYCYRIRVGNRLTPGLDSSRMRLDYLRSEAKNHRAATGLVRSILAVNVLAGKVRFNARGESRPSRIWPVFAALRRVIVFFHLILMR